jgi:hypothetical protein
MFRFTVDFVFVLNVSLFPVTQLNFSPDTTSYWEVSMP